MWTDNKSQTKEPEVYQQILETLTATVKIFLKNLKKIFIDSPESGKIIVNQTQTYQEIFGFGGAVTDSAAINIFNLTQKAADNLLKYNRITKYLNSKRVLLI